MPLTAAPAGVSIGTAATTICSNPADSGENRTFEVQLTNYDGTNDVDVVSCQWVDYRAGSATAVTNAAHHLMPTNYTLKAKVGLFSFRKVLEPGDSIRAIGSAAGDIWAVADMIFAESAT